MGKFVKSVIDKAKAFTNERRKNIIDKAATIMFTDYEKKFKLFLKGINGFISGSPNKTDELAFTTLYKFPGYGIDRKTSCDDGDYKGVKARKRCHLIHKRWIDNKIVLSEDKLWLKRELIPYLKYGFEKQSGKVFETLGNISDDESKEAYLLFSKNKNKFKELLK
jgi:hypothetical protein